jgi:hypothetical protein
VSCNEIRKREEKIMMDIKEKLKQTKIHYWSKENSVIIFRERLWWKSKRVHSPEWRHACRCKSYGTFQTTSGRNLNISCYQKWEFLNLNPPSPSFQGLMKVHKEEHPIRPAINWLNVPANTLAQHLVPSSERHDTLACSFHIRNTTAISHKIPWRHKTRVSLDIKSTYTNVPPEN